MTEPVSSRGFRGRRQPGATAARLPPGQYETRDFPGNRGPPPGRNAAVRRHIAAQPRPWRRSEGDRAPRHRGRRHPARRHRAIGPGNVDSATASGGRGVLRCPRRRQRAAEWLRCVRETARGQVEGRQGGAAHGVERGPSRPDRHTGTRPTQGLKESEQFGLDDFINSYSDGAAAWIVVLVAVLLGLRHATDPDHIAAVTTLVAGSDVDDVVACVSAGCPVVTSPMAGMKRPTVEAKVAEFVTDSELRAIRATCQSRSRRNYRGRRCEAIIRLLGATGCLLSEIADLIVDDIDLGDRGRIARSVMSSLSWDVV